MPKIHPFSSQDELSKGFLVYCPGCKSAHPIHVARGPNNPGPCWSFNGDLERPTFAPSILSNPENHPSYPRCHSYLRDGAWQFLSDCSHELAGKTIPLEERASAWPD